MEKVQLGELSGVAKKILQSLDFARDKSRATIIALSGDLGAGKTTFVQALAKELRVTSAVQSPTYVLMKSYPINFKGLKKLIHIDAYRLENAEQLRDLKPEQFLKDPSTLAVIEWPERVEGALPKPDLAIKFSSDGASEGERYIEVV